MAINTINPCLLSQDANKASGHRMDHSKILSVQFHPSALHRFPSFHPCWSGRDIGYRFCR